MTATPLMAAGTAGSAGWDCPEDWGGPSESAARRAVASVMLNDLTQLAGGTCLDLGDLAMCISPETPPKQLEEIMERLSGGIQIAYARQGRWSSTASGSTGSQGNPIRLTYSFVPDGVNIPGGTGESSGPNTLHATFDAKFGGNRALWKAKFAQAFNQWTAVTGITYTEVSDDGASFPNSPGQLGKRGDVRIASHNIDGSYGVIGYTWFPNGGDMVFDSSENWGSSSGDYLMFRNTCIHEHGHGIGLGHVWPVNKTKIMEPMLATNFNGPQDDDIRGAVANYGDPYENDDSPAAAANLGALGATATLANARATDSAGDVDWYTFSVAPASLLNVTVTPVGATYQVGTSSDSTPTINTKAVNNLQIQVYDSSGAVLLTTGNSAGAGSPELLDGYPLPLGGRYYVKVSNAGTPANTVQRYTASFSATGGVVQNDPPEILSVSASPNLVASGDGVLVTVEATDDAGVLSVTANGAVLAKSGATTWTGTLTASGGEGDHLINVVAHDASGATDTNSSQSYRVGRVVSIAARQMTCGTVETGSQHFLFRVYGRVVQRDLSALLIDDGSGLLVQVLATGNAVSVGDFVSARGVLVPGAVLTIQSSATAVSVL